MVDRHKKNSSVEPPTDLLSGEAIRTVGGEDMSELLLSSMSGTFVPYVEIWASEMPLFSNVA